MHKNSWKKSQQQLSRFEHKLVKTPDLEAVPSALAFLSKVEAPEKGPEMTTFFRDETSK